MRNSPQALLGSRSSGSGLGPEGQVDFRLARRAVLSELRKGRLGRPDVCDAHPELLRAARSVGEATVEPCPVCEEHELVHVSYVFGPGLPPSGRTISSEAELRRLARRGRDQTCYVVEVCPGCGWNHLARTFRVGRAERA